MNNTNDQICESMVEAKNLLYEIIKNDIPTIEHCLDVYSLVYPLYWKLPARLKRMLNKEDLFNAAMLHDVGKGLIPDEILKRPCELNPTEREIMKSHAAKGKMILEKTRFKHIADWVCYHHERVDGAGYYGLTPEKTPLASQIIAVVDTYSALTSDRVYRNHCSAKKALKVLKEVSGTQLDKGLVNIFCGVVENPDTAIKIPIWINSKIIY